MENLQLETTYENQYLEKVLILARQQLKRAQETLDKKQMELIEIKEEIRENTEHRITNIYSPDDFESLVELSQSSMPVAEMVADCDKIIQKISRLENLIKSPYFARIDFCFEEEEIPENIYIGRSSLSKEKNTEIYIYDWRSPIASVFYQFMLGKASYNAPCGKVYGEVKLKRQYEIKDSKLLYFFDTDVNINDEILKQMLSKNTSPKMKTIVETIQKEQDTIIRDMQSELLMIQGVAGSGKTSIALHRAAYLMYEGLQSNLSANNILILSPNTIFEQYISDVLPELGERNVVSIVFEDILHTILKENMIQPKRKFLEKIVSNSPYKEIIKRSIEFKTSEKFKQILDQFVLDIPCYEMEFQDIYFAGQCIAKKEEMKNWVCQHTELPLAIRLEQLENRILEKGLESKKRIRKKEKDWIMQEIKKVTKLNISNLYKNLWKNSLYIQLEEKEEFFEDVEKIRKHTLNNIKSNFLYFDDAIAVLYLYLKIYGNKEYKDIRQVIIDEAQDYYPLQFEILQMLFKQVKFTVLGDINQTISKQENILFYKQVQKYLKKEKSTLIQLNKSFRCTNEILQFSLQFVDAKLEIQSFNRAGDAVTAVALESLDEYLDKILQKIMEYREKGFESICLICKTRETCKRLFLKLKSRIEIQFITDDSVGSLQGTLILPSYMAKGLEFDAVIICDANVQNYNKESDKNLLYMECTRALHSLSLFCVGESCYARNNKMGFWNGTNKT